MEGPGQKLVSKAGDADRVCLQCGDKSQKSAAAHDCAPGWRGLSFKHLHPLHMHTCMCVVTDGGGRTTSSFGSL